MELPEIIISSRLWARLKGERQLAAAIETLRAKADTIAKTISRTLPEFTDHSVRHMDSLWAVADQVLTDEEAAQVTPAEAFLLGTAFFLHDLGMARAATEEGLRKIRSSAPYKQFLARMEGACGSADEWEALLPAMEGRALSVAIRSLHAEVAPKLATEAVPGTNIFLLEPSDLRKAWGAQIGRIAASHHWNLDRVDSELGRKGIVPMPVGGADLGYVACLLRVIDYAHINRDRAPTIERALRQDMPSESLLHWLAQQHIDGPIRDGVQLVYHSSAPVEDVDAWWLYYNMLLGLDSEIRAVRRYLAQRPSTESRLSLASVRGAASPEECAIFIEPRGFIPIEVNIRAASIERIVQILGGESLYGPNTLVPVRELIQNARDALELKAATAQSDIERKAAELPIEVTLRTTPEAMFEIVDHGVGMSLKVMQDYLVTIASDYWNSEQFFADFPGARERGFSPAGKFGIGFISVFMVSDEVEIASNREGQERLQLFLRGVGRRGEVRKVEGPPGSATSVKLRLRQDTVEAFEGIAEKIRNLAPMLRNRVKVNADGQTSVIEPGWWQHESQADFIQSVMRILPFVDDLSSARRGPSLRAFSHIRWRRAFTGDRDEIVENPWPSVWPECCDDRRRILAHPDLAGVVLCLRGIAVSTSALPGFVGLVNLDIATPDARRTSLLDLDVDALRADARRIVHNGVVRNLNTMGEAGFVEPKSAFIANCVQLYGDEVARDSSLRWLSLVRPPGEVEMVSCSDFLTRAAAAQQVRVSAGTGPWTSMRWWARPKVKRSDTDVEVVLGDDPNAHIPYLTSDETKSGTLDDVWPLRRDRGATFPLLLSLLSEAWQTAVPQLLKQSTWEAKSGRIFGELTR